MIVQENVADLCGSSHGIKVILSLLTDGEKHLPPHAVAVLHPAKCYVSAAAHGATNSPKKTATDAAQAHALRATSGGASASVGNTEGQNNEGTDSAAVEMQELGLSKKDAQTRRAELLASGKGSLARALLAHCTENADALMRSAQGAQLIGELACGGAGGAVLWTTEQAAVKGLHEAIAQAAGGGRKQLEEIAGAAESSEPLVENLFASRLLRRLVQRGGACAAAGHIAKTLWEQGLRERCRATMQGHGAKIVAALAESTDAELRKAVRRCVAEYLDAGSVDQWLQQFHITA